MSPRPSPPTFSNHFTRPPPKPGCTRRASSSPISRTANTRSPSPIFFVRSPRPPPQCQCHPTHRTASPPRIFPSPNAAVSTRESRAPRHRCRCRFCLSRKRRAPRAPHAPALDRPATPNSREPAGFSAQWRGTVFADETGDHEFVIRTPNSVRVWINAEPDLRAGSEPTLDINVSTPKDPDHRVTLRLLGGRAYPIAIDWWALPEKPARPSCPPSRSAGNRRTAASARSPRAIFHRESRAHLRRRVALPRRR